MDAAQLAQSHGYTIVENREKTGITSRYLVYSDQFDSHFILKIIPDFPDRRIEKKAQATMQLCHPNILRTLDVFVVNSTVCMICEYCRHGSLAEELKKGVPDFPRAMILFRQICDGLAYCHDNNFPHGSMCVENILLDDFCRPVIDIGAVPEMLPPEAKTQDYNLYQADIWLLGVLVHKIVFGTLPSSSSINPSKCPSQDLCMLLAKMLNPVPDQRPSIQTVQSTATEIDNKYGSRPVRSSRSVGSALLNNVSGMKPFNGDDSILNQTFLAKSRANPRVTPIKRKTMILSTPTWA